MGMYGYIWVYMGMYGYVCVYMGMYWYIRVCMGIRGGHTIMITINALGSLFICIIEFKTTFVLKVFPPKKGP